MMTFVIHHIIRLLGRLMYPHVQVLGSLPDGPLLLAPNHPNGLLDGLLLANAFQRPVAFLAKSTFLAHPLLGPILRAFGAIPVWRVSDAGKPGGPPVGSTLDNTDSFAAARALLHAGGVLVIFPEGTTNLEPVLLPLKTGLARIALAAEAAVGWNAGVQIVPVGLWYQRQASAGSAAVIALGPPLSFGDLQGMYQRDPQQAVRDATAQLRPAIELAVVTARQHAVQWQHTGIKRTTSGRLWQILALAPALIGLVLAAPGLLLARVILVLIGLRHRTSVGTANLAALVAGLMLGWLTTGLIIGLSAGWWLASVYWVSAIVYGWATVWYRR